MGKSIEIKTEKEFVEIFDQPQELIEDQKRIITENIDKEYNPWFIRINENGLDPSEIRIYDKFQITPNTLEETVNESDFLFVCVPTPMDDSGKQDLSAVYDA